MKRLKQINNISKNDIRSAVKEEIKPFKKEFKSFKDEMKGEFISFKLEIKEDIKDLFEKYFTKYHDDVLTKMDKGIGLLKSAFEEQVVHSGKHEEINDRLENIEEIHPQGKHI